MRWPGRRLAGVYLLVRLIRGGPWDFSRSMREQDGFEEHARFMDELVEEGFVVLGGPLDERRIALVIDADSEDEVRSRLAQDNWTQNGMLTIGSLEPWTILLDGRRRGLP